MATTLLARGTTATTSSPVTINAGESIVLHLNSSVEAIVEAGIVYIEFQNQDMSFSPVGVLSPPNNMTAQITAPTNAPLVCRVNRPVIDSWRPGVGVTQA